MSNYRMNWKSLISEDSQRGRTNFKITGDLRSPFEKDYHRILSSASFRRLQDKTQVFPLEKNDFIRTRLTHSIEVSSFARSLAQSVSSKIILGKLDDDFGYEEANHISNILASAALLHDIGNPPFGHFGEDSIREWFRKKLEEIEVQTPIEENYYDEVEKKKLNKILTKQMCEDFKMFEGNAQAIRLVSKLHFFLDENGMNLTYALLNTLIKYPVSSTSIDRECNDIRKKKMGYYFAEQELFNKIVEGTGTKDKETGEVYRHPLTFLLEAADDIAYCTADVEDGVKKGFIHFEDLLECISSIKDETLKNNLMEKLEYFKKVGVDNDYENPEIYGIQRWIVSLQAIFLNIVSNSFIKNYTSIMNGAMKTDIFKDTEIEEIVKELKKLATKKVFNSKAIIKMEIAANNILSFFLENFMNAFLYYDTDLSEEKMTGIDQKFIDIISDNYLHIYKHYSKQYENNEGNKFLVFQYKLYLRLLLVTDYICGMTDSYAKTLYQELVGID